MTGLRKFIGGRWDGLRLHADELYVNVSDGEHSCWYSRFRDNYFPYRVVTAEELVALLAEGRSVTRVNQFRD